MPLRNKWNKVGHLHLSTWCWYGKCKGPAVPVHNYAPCHDDMRGSGGIILCIFNLSTRGSWWVSFLTWPLYPLGKSPQCPLHRGLVGPWASATCCGEETNLLLLGMEPQSCSHPVITPTGPHMLSCRRIYEITISLELVTMLHTESDYALAV